LVNQIDVHLLDRSDRRSFLWFDVFAHIEGAGGTLRGASSPISNVLCR
jgi:hypothetical protein